MRPPLISSPRHLRHAGHNSSPRRPGATFADREPARKADSARAAWHTSDGHVWYSLGSPATIADERAPLAPVPSSPRRSPGLLVEPPMTSTCTRPTLAALLVGATLL